MYELLHPEISINQLLDISPKVLMPADVCTDCNDLHLVVIKAAVPTISNRALTLYIAALREAKLIGRIRDLYWIDTNDMISNCLTKIDVTSADMMKALKQCYWEPIREYQRNHDRIVPTKTKK